MSQTPIIVWFRNDLRLGDHAALMAAVESDEPVLAIYVFDDAAAGTWKPGGASRWWLHQSLARLGESLAAKGCPFVLRRGDTLDNIASLAADVGADTVTCSRSFEPWARQLEEALQSIDAAFPSRGGLKLAFGRKDMTQRFRVFARDQVFVGRAFHPASDIIGQQ